MTFVVNTNYIVMAFAHKILTKKIENEASLNKGLKGIKDDE